MYYYVCDLKIDRYCLF